MDSFPTPHRTVRTLRLLAAVVAALCAVPACGDGASSSAAAASASTNEQNPAASTLTLGAYTTPREAYGKAILPGFKARFREQAGAEVDFKESYLGSGAQARAIIGGFEADIAALSLEPDIEKLRAAGLIKHDWKAGEHRGMVSRSVVVIGVRKGNPKNIREWTDLARGDVKVLTPDVRTSGGAMWNVAAIYGAALRANGAAGAPAAPEAATASASKLLASVLANVEILDKGARESLLNFERGVGDAIITYENEILVGRLKGQDYEYVIPKSTILIENPIALVDANVEKHGSRKAAEAFLAFVRTPEAQRGFAEYGLRPVTDAVATELAARFPKVSDQFTVEDLGGWTKLQKELFDKGAIYDQALEAARGAKK